MIERHGKPVVALAGMGDLARSESSSESTQERDGELEPGQTASAVALLREDTSAVYRVVEMDPVTADRAIEVAERHRLRAYDYLQLATALLVRDRRDALRLSPLIFASSDRELSAAAESEGLAVEDPAI